MTTNAYVINGSGEQEPFNEEKLRLSLERAGAKETEVNEIVMHISNEIESGMTTDKIFRHAYSVLARLKDPAIVGRYSLRRALLELGPTGFPFEKYLAQIFAARGYETAVNQTVMGNCVAHEMDVVAWNSEKLVMVESKFHNTVGEKTDLKVALYIKARFDDLSDQTFDYGFRRPLDEGWLITNTKFTDTAIRYGECAKLRMIGWNYPVKGNLREIIEDLNLHPITSLANITDHEKQLLLNNGVVLCKQVRESRGKILSLGLDENTTSKISASADAVCGIS